MAIDINELRKVIADCYWPTSPVTINALLDRLEAAEADALEQARLNGMGGEREAALMAKLEAAEKSDAESLTMYRKARDERDALRAKIEQMEKQEPAAEVESWTNGSYSRNYKLRWLKDVAEGDRLYALPGAQPAPSFADAYQGAMEEVAIWKKRALEAEDLNRKFVAEINGPTYMGGPAQPASSTPEGWLQAIDEALVVAHIGVANADDTYEQAKAKLNNLIGFHADVATDPAVNGGWKLVPIEPTEEMLRAMTDPFIAINGDNRTAFESAYKAMLAAAPEAKP